MVAVGLWFAVALVVTLCVPLFPVDENRLLTVAWEMRTSGDWLLPSMNYSPYAHKPPLLFWLINAAWSVFGETVWVARLVASTITAGVVLATFVLARRLYPGDRLIAPLSAFILVAGPAIIIHGAMLMYDLLLALWVVMGLTALWTASQRRSVWAWAVFGAAIGLGVLTKGPVILVFLLLPAVLVQMWKPDKGVSLRHFFAMLVVAVVLGAVVALSWAIPAAIKGGPAYSELIFWKQSADRIAGTMHHKRPFWYYGPVLVAFALPFLLWRPLWRGLQEARTSKPSPATMFLAISAGSAILAMSLVGGKQIHYLLPIVPALSILAARLAGSVNSRRGDAAFAVAPYVIALLLLAALPSLVDVIGAFSAKTGDGLARAYLIDPWVFVAAIPLVVATYALGRRGILSQAIAMAVANAVVMSAIAVQINRNLFQLYDLTPLVAALQPYENEPLLFAGRYLGQIGYPARLTQKVDVAPANGVGAWLQKNPGGVAVVHDLTPETAAAFEVVYSQPYGLDQSLWVVRAKQVPVR